MSSSSLAHSLLDTDPTGPYTKLKTLDSPEWLKVHTEPLGPYTKIPAWEKAYDTDTSRCRFAWAHQALPLLPVLYGRFNGDADSTIEELFVPGELVKHLGGRQNYKPYLFKLEANVAHLDVAWCHSGIRHERGGLVPEVVQRTLCEGDPRGIDEILLYGRILRVLCGDRTCQWSRFVIGRLRDLEYWIRSMLVITTGFAIGLGTRVHDYRMRDPWHNRTGGWVHTHRLPIPHELLSDRLVFLKPASMIQKPLFEKHPDPTRFREPFVPETAMSRVASYSSRPLPSNGHPETCLHGCEHRVGVHGLLGCSYLRFVEQQENGQEVRLEPQITSGWDRKTGQDLAVFPETSACIVCTPPYHRASSEFQGPYSRGDFTSSGNFPVCLQLALCRSLSTMLERDRLSVMGLMHELSRVLGGAKEAVHIAFMYCDEYSGSDVVYYTDVRVKRYYSAVFNLWRVNQAAAERKTNARLAVAAERKTDKRKHRVWVDNSDSEDIEEDDEDKQETTQESADEIEEDDTQERIDPDEVEEVPPPAKKLKRS